MTLLGMDKIRKFQWVTDEEYRGIVSNHVLISLFGVKLYRKSAWIPLGICGTLFASYSRKTDEKFG